MQVVLVRTLLSWNPKTWIKFIIRKINKTYYDKVCFIQRVNGVLLIFDGKDIVSNGDWKENVNPMRILKLDEPLKDGVNKLTAKQLEKYLK
jgi:hypothetical protein